VKTIPMDIPTPTRAERLRTLFNLMRSLHGSRRPFAARLDEPAYIALLPEALRREAREDFVRDLQDAVAMYAGQLASVHATYDGSLVTYHVRGHERRAA
jgi:hypothetical protein